MLQKSFALIIILLLNFLFGCEHSNIEYSYPQSPDVREDAKVGSLLNKKFSFNTEKRESTKEECECENHKCSKCSKAAKSSSADNAKKCKCK